MIFFHSKKTLAGNSFPRAAIPDVPWDCCAAGSSGGGGGRMFVSVSLFICVRRIFFVIISQ
jgi:hypothetical protein